MTDLVLPHDSVLHGVSSLPFVGRDAELALLTAACERALAGAGQLVLLAGEPGIGKTRTAEQTAVLARARGALALWGNCYEWEGAPPFWPWGQVFAGWQRSASDTELEAALAGDASFIAQIAPEIAARLHLPSIPSTANPDGQLFRLLMAAATTLRRAASVRPLMLVFDDIHWADKPSLQLLQFLAQEIREAPLLLVATYRNLEIGREHPAAPILADLARAPNCHRVVLRGLPKPQIARFMALVAGDAQPQRLVDAVTEETAGNPFFVAEVVRLLAAEGQLGQARSTATLPRVPESVREAILRRLDRLSNVCNTALAAASVIGREFELRLLERVSGLLAIDLLAAMDEAIRASLLGTSESIAGSYRFSHALVQEALYQELPATERARLHLATGEALAAQTGDREPPWEALAHHFHHALPLGDQDRVANCAQHAGDAAFDRFAWDAAAAHFRHALDALDAAGSTGARRRCDLLLSLGEAQNRAGSGSGDVPAARETLRRAFALARSLHYPDGMARSAVAFAGLNMSGAFGGTEQVAMHEQALTALSTAANPLRVRTLGRLAADLTNRSLGRDRRARLLADEAVVLAEQLDDPASQAFARWARYCARPEIADLPLRTRDAEAVRVFGERAGDPLFTSWGQFLQFLCFLEIGNVTGAEHTLLEMEEASARAHIPYVVQRCAVYRGMFDLMRGRYGSAADQITLADRLWQSDAPRQHRAQSYVLLRDLGRVAELTGELVVPDEFHAWHQAARAHRMLLALDRGQPERARFDYDALIAAGAIRQPTMHVWFSVAIRLAEAAIAFGDRAVTAELFEALTPAADRCAADGVLGLCHGPVALYLGQLATALEQWEAAEAHLARALAMSQHGGLSPFVARGLLARATLYARRGQPGDRRTARGLAQQALAEADAIGMRGLEPVCHALLADLTPMSGGRFGLTARELEVIRLLVDGLSDAVIAERLSLSPRTINSHLTAIYAKLDVSSRLAAAQVATAHDLI